MSQNKGSQELAAHLSMFVPERSYDNLPPTSRIALVSLIDRISPTLNYGKQPSARDFEDALPNTLQKGLFIPWDEENIAGHNVEHFVAFTRKRPKAYMPYPDKDRKFYAVAFQPREFSVVARSAPDLGRHIVVRTLASNWQANHPGEVEPDMETRIENSKRSGGHALDQKIKAIDILSASLLADNLIYRYLLNHIKNPDQSKYRARLRAMDQKRAYADEKIHDTVELSGIYWNSSNKSLQRQHNVVRRKIYAGNYSHSERASNLSGYLTLVGIHNRAKLYKMSISRERTNRELKEKYQQHLDKKGPVVEQSVT
jgi:hypothetical protein